jgi:hypothetical protein
MDNPKIYNENLNSRLKLIYKFHELHLKYRIKIGKVPD